MGTVVSALDPRGGPFQGLVGYIVVGGICAVLARMAWKEVAGRDTPRTLAVAFGLALALRLGVGIGLTHALPVYGYDRELQQAGFVFQDAWLRDNDAWALGRSDRPLSNAFLQPQESDQYGGLLWISAAIYRFLSGGFHQPLMVVLLTATIGTLAVLFTWAFASMEFGSRIGSTAGWVVALYPDFVLLSSSQMREPFIVAGLALSLYGYAQIGIGSLRKGAFGLLAGALLALLVSPPSALGILFVAGLGWLWEGRSGGGRAYRALPGFAVLALIAAILTGLTWSAVQGATGDHPLGPIGRWLTEGAQFQLRLLESSSGWVQKLFEATPEWAHMPLATAYGLTRPLLPAALADRTGAALWQAIEIWRAVGWFAVLPVLLYAPVAAMRGVSWRDLSVYLSLLFWAVAVLASYRAAGDDWDNPRYRTALLPVMATVIGWAWWHARGTKSPWLGRSCVVVWGAGLIFTHWFVGRYYGTPRLSLESTLSAMVGCAVLYLGGLAWSDARKRRRSVG